LRFLILLTTCTLLSAGLLYGQAGSPPLSGVVADSAGRPIANASVWVSNTDYHALTDAEGRFVFDSLPAEIVTLRAGFIGYRSRQLDSVRTSPGQTTQVSFQLETSPIKSSCTLRVPGPASRTPERTLR